MFELNFNLLRSAKKHLGEKITVDLIRATVGNELRGKIHMMAQKVIPAFVRA